VFDLTTRYMSLDLRNPIVIASSGMVSTLAGIRQCEQAGAGAVVLKSVFEEQHRGSGPAPPGKGAYWEGMEPGRLIREAVRTASIPLLGSLCCTSDPGWSAGAAMLQKAGVRGIELNVPPAVSAEEAAATAGASKGSRTGYGERCVRALRSVRAKTSLPLAVKLSPYVEALPRLVRRLAEKGAAAVALFNRHYRFDVDTETLSIIPAEQMGSQSDYYEPLRWTSLLAGRVGCDLSAAQGISDAEAALKLVLAGATTVQLCSTVMIHGTARITAILRSMGEWMERHGYAEIGRFRGLLSQKKSPSPWEYEETEYR